MKEIKIMARADFAGDVALWIFFMMCTFIYTYTFLRIYIYIFIFIIIIITIMGLSSTTS